jgi:DNA-directed RNA polymerase specialized sigma24 family protein
VTIEPSDPRSSQPRQDARLLAEVRSRNPSALATITTRFGRELTGIAYLVLQHQEGAADAVARGIADAWRQADDLATIPDIEGLRTALLGATARHALLSHRSSRSVDPIDPTVDGPRRDVMTGLSPQARAAFALRYAAGLEEADVAALLEIAPAGVNRLLEPAADEARRAAAVAQLASLPVTVDVERVRAALAEPSRAPSSRRPWAAVAAVVGVLLLIRLAAPPSEPPSAQPSLTGEAEQPATGAPTAAGDGRDSLGADSPWSRFWPGEGLVPPFTLADCHIEPASLPISFAGWVTVEEIRANGVAPPGRSVYAIVTRGDAEWIGYRYTHDRPVFPRPVGRLGCVFEPDSGSHVAIGVAQDWEPPALADGCPASPINSFAGYRELGGPGAFVLVDTRSAWWADDPELSFLVRVAPAPLAGSSVEAWLQPVGAGPLIPATVGEQAADPGSVLNYLRVDGVEVPEPGCWVMNIAVDGSVVGSAVLPVVARASAQ